MQDKISAQSDPPVTKPLIRIFLVDDHPIFAEVLGEMLNRSGDFTVVGTANDGETALKRLAGLAVDIVIVDLMLPGMGGLELLEALRANKYKAKLVMCSGLGTDSLIMESFALGVTAFIEKTMAVEELFSTLRSVAAGNYPLSSRTSGLLRDIVRDRAACKPVAAGDILFLRRLAMGHTLKQIAVELGISASGAYKTRSRIKSRMNIKGPTGFFHAAMNLGLVYPSMVSVDPVGPGSKRRGVVAISS